LLELDGLPPVPPAADGVMPVTGSTKIVSLFLIIKNGSAV